jgi:hypothetical protein
VHRARVFNLDRKDLIAKVAQPWLEDRAIQMGEREWVPRQSSLRILEGARMQTADLSFGQGWANAERACEDVTRALLDEAPPPTVPDAFVVESENPEGLLAGLLAEHRGEPIQWARARERLDGHDPEVAAVILVVRKRRE